MSFWPFEVTTPHIIYALLGAFIVLFGMFSLFLRERLYVGEAIWAFIFGVIIGPYCADIFDPRSWGSSGATSEATTNAITLEFTRVVLAIGVFAIGVELPKAYMKKHWKSLFFLLVPVMAWGWFVSAAFIFALIPGLNFLSSLAVAACLTPTDPILAAAVVGGKWADKHVPAHIRHLLAAESGCNDGAAFPFLYLALYLTIDKTTGHAMKDWFLELWLYQVILGAIIGCLLGYGFRHLMKFCQRHDLIDRHSYVAQYFSLAMLTIGVTTLLGSDDLLAAFFCGTAFAWDGFFNKQTEESVFSSVIDTLFNVAAFIYVGAWMPFNKFQDAELTLSVWRLLVLAILVLLLRRLPIMMLLYRWIPDIKTFREAVFSGHFGPIGIGAVFISTFAVEILEGTHEGVDASSHKADTQQSLLLAKTIQPIVAFMVLCSITIHGLSIPSFSLGRRVHSVSRTWSRRDTMGSTRQQPEWANQLRMVSRAEDIIINRDKEDNVNGIDLERGDLEKETSNSSGSVSGTANASLDTQGEDPEHLHEKMKEGELSEETRVLYPNSDSPRARFVDIGVGGSRPATRPGTPAPAIVAPTTSTGVTAREGAAAAQPRKLHQLPIPQSDRDNPPDGAEDVHEWIEGNQRVIEKRMKPGSDVEVTIVHNDSGAQTRWQGKAHELGQNAEEIKHAITRELGHLSSRANEAVVSPSRAQRTSSGSLRRTESGSSGKEREVGEDEQRKASAKLREIVERGQQQRQQQENHEGSITDGEEDDEGWASDPDNGSPAPTLSGSTMPAIPRLAHSSSRSSKLSHVHVQHCVHASAHRRWRPSIRRNSLAGSADMDNEPRGRPGSISAGAGTIPSTSGPSTSSDPPTTQASTLFQSQLRTQTSSTYPSTTSADTGSRPGTSSRTNTFFSVRTGTTRSSRPGTADSLGSFSSARNPRVENIRQQGTSTRGTPTRESSPSRSVRFVDEVPVGDYGNILTAGLEVGGERGALADSPVAEEEPGPGGDNNV